MLRPQIKWDFIAGRIVYFRINLLFNPARLTWIQFRRFVRLNFSDTGTRRWNASNTKHVGDVRIVFVGGTVVGHPGVDLHEIGDETGHQTLQYAGVALQHELVDDAALIKLLDNCNERNWRQALMGDEIEDGSGSTL